MNVIFRKDDSSTSILLFIYNTMYSRIQKTSFNLSSMLEIMTLFDKAETATRMSLSRACKSGILETSKTKKDVIYSLTPDAIDFIRCWNNDAMACWKRFALRNTPWDEKWHLVHIATNTATKKNDLSEKLQQLGYVQINVQMWLSPYNQADAIKVILSELGIIADITSVHGDFYASAGVEAFTQNIYGLSSLENQYTKFNHIYQPLHTQIKENPAIIADGKALPLLHKLGFSFFEIASLDPMLPCTLLPLWKGDSSALLMRDLRTTLENASWDYLKKHC